MAIVGRGLRISSFTVEYEDKEIENCTTDNRTLASNRGEGVEACRVLLQNLSEHRDSEGVLLSSSPSLPTLAIPSPCL